MLAVFSSLFDIPNTKLDISYIHFSFDFFIMKLMYGVGTRPCPVLPPVLHVTGWFEISCFRPSVQYPSHMLTFQSTHVHSWLRVQFIIGTEENTAFDFMWNDEKCFKQRIFPKGINFETRIVHIFAYPKTHVPTKSIIWIDHKHYTQLW